jgi:hypothetical protein
VFNNFDQITTVRSLQLRSGGGWNDLMSELTPKPNSTGSKKQKKNKKKTF